MILTGLSEVSAYLFNHFMSSEVRLMNKLMRTVISISVVIFALSMSCHGYVTVLLYHKFDEADSPSTSISTAMFAEQMNYLETAGYTVLSMDDLMKCIAGKRAIPERAVLITLDDGYLSEYIHAVPVLKEHGYPFCVFVFTRSVGAHNFMNWDQLRQIRSLGGEVGSHTHTHPHLVDSSPEEIEREFIQSKEILEKNLGTRVHWFAYPFGDYDNTIRSIGLKGGYKLLLTSDPGSVGPDTQPDLVPRQAIVGQNMNMERFKEKLNSPPLCVLSRSPGRGRIPTPSISKISVTIKNPDQYYPGQVQMFLSERGRLNTKFNPITGILSCGEEVVLTRKINRIITTARRKDDNLYAMDSYMIVLPEDVIDVASKAYSPQPAN
jgi:peptidoglycan/xylan/chitin deacetylase (PgdA/CDA1 family)